MLLGLVALVAEGRVPPDGAPELAVPRHAAYAACTKTTILRLIIFDFKIQIKFKSWGFSIFFDYVTLRGRQLPSTFGRGLNSVTQMFGRGLNSMTQM